MLTPGQVERYLADGFVKGSRVVDTHDIELLRDEVMRVIAEQGKRGVPQPVMCRNLSGDESAPVWQIVNIWEASAPFRRLIHNATIGEEIAQLTGAAELRVWHDQIQYKPAGRGGVTRWHQDSPYWPILTPLTSTITAWVALDDVDEANGCMSMIPGSHQWGNNIEYLHTINKFEEMPGNFEDRKVSIRCCPVRVGEVHYHHPLAWHASHANTSSRPRRAIAIHLMTPETRYVASGEHPMKPFVEVADGAMMQGVHFPLVWHR